jgi:hypothetical protein
MFQLPPLVPGITIWQDTLAEGWRLETSDQTYVLTAWDWSQRRQMVRSAVVARQFQGHLFVQGVFAWLVDPTPLEDSPELAYVCLHLLDVPQQPPSISLLQAEMLLAKTFGWRPGDLQGQPVASLDEMVATLAPSQESQSRQTADQDGWISIQVVDDAGSTTSSAANGSEIAAGLEQMLASVKVWAGLAVESLTEDEQAKLAPASSDMVPSSVNQSENAALAHLQSGNSEQTRSRADLPSQDPPTTQPPSFEDESTALPRMNRFNHPVRLPAPNPSSPQRKDWSVPAAAVSQQSADRVTPQPLSMTEPWHRPVHGVNQETDNSGSRIGEDIPVAAPLPSPHSGWREPLQILARAEAPFPEIPAVGPSSGLWQETDWAPLYREAAEGPIQAAAAFPSRKTMEPLSSPWSESVTVTPPQSPTAFAPITEGQGRANPSRQEVAVHPQNDWNTENEQLPLPPAIPLEDPFALSTFEEHLADALERAAREAGVDLP